MRARGLTLGRNPTEWRRGDAGKNGAWMSSSVLQRSDWPIVGVCLTLSGFGLSAVPFIGTKYGDWPEAMALGVGLLPLIYVAIYMGIRSATRLAEIDERLQKLEASRTPVKLQSAPASISAISASDKPK
jgi:hypothetical protein